MELKIVSKFGENIFDMPGEKVIEILHHAMLYSKEKEKSAGTSRQEPAGKAFTGGGAGATMKDDEKIAEEENGGETAATESMGMPEKTKEHTRNDNLFGNNWRDAASESKAPRDYGNLAEGYRGFLYIKCPVCGKVKGFCTKSDITEHICECGYKVRLKELKPMYVHCECCGRDFKYFTNMDEESFEYQCMNCGSPVDMRLNKRGTAYVNLAPNRSGGIYDTGNLGIKAGGRHDRKYKKAYKVPIL